MEIKIGAIVALIGPTPWACRVRHFVDVPHGGVGPLFPIGDYWHSGRWYCLDRLWLIDPDMSPYEERAAVSTEKVYDIRLLDYRRATADELQTAEKFHAVWAHETRIAPMQSESDVPLGCLRRIKYGGADWDKLCAE